MATAERGAAKVQKWVDEQVFILTLNSQEAGNLMDLLGSGVDFDSVWSTDRGLGLSEVYYALSGAGAIQGNMVWRSKARTLDSQILVC